SGETSMKEMSNEVSATGRPEERSVKEVLDGLSAKVESEDATAIGIAEEMSASEKSVEMFSQDVSEDASVKEVSEDASKKHERPWNSFDCITWPRESILRKTFQAEKTVQEWIRIYGRKFDQFDFAFNYVAGQNRVHVVYDDGEIPENLWFIGDVHGDILALDAALSFIDSQTSQATIVFLGDLFDRFEYGLDVVMRVIALINERPGRILWIAGNHDDGLFYENGEFGSKVMPSEFCLFLNRHKEYEEFGRWLIDFCKILPRALFLPDGLFVAHGGCPSFDMNTFAYSIDDVSKLQDLENEKYLRSFIWNRLIPGQDDKSEPEVGKNDLIHFMEKMEKLTGNPVKRMLRGHDHCKETRHEFFESYYPQAPVLTITTMSAWYLGTEDFAPELNISLRKKTITTPSVARFKSGKLPEVFTIDIPLSVVQQFHKVEDLPSQK
ncbi:MAG: serine/threonine protein phosphatase, partial [Victivallales bacterium]|nr:serine/threonine protein phosphatase [Victivallales bacterium]